MGFAEAFPAGVVRRQLAIVVQGIGGVANPFHRIGGTLFEDFVCRQVDGVSTGVYVGDSHYCVIGHMEWPPHNSSKGVL